MMIYIVMEKGDKDLSSLMRQEGQLQIWRVMTFWSNMLQAVQVMQKHDMAQLLVIL